VDEVEPKESPRGTSESPEGRSKSNPETEGGGISGEREKSTEDPLTLIEGSCLWELPRQKERWGLSKKLGGKEALFTRKRVNKEGTDMEILTSRLV